VKERRDDLLGMLLRFPGRYLTCPGRPGSPAHTVIAQTEACSLVPEEASARIASVADNRESLPNQVARITAPTSATRAALDELQTALVHSRDADRLYAQWILGQTAWYYTTPVGCPSRANASQ
jgi:hypothetical protein